MAFLAITTSLVASADTAVCQGKISAVANHANGHNGLFTVINQGNIFKLCSFNAAQFTVTPEDCQHMASIASMAFALDTNVVVYVDNAPTTLCSSIPNWHAANTRYLATEK